MTIVASWLFLATADFELMCSPVDDSNSSRWSPAQPRILPSVAGTQRISHCLLETHLATFSPCLCRDIRCRTLAGLNHDGLETSMLCVL